MVQQSWIVNIIGADAFARLSSELSGSELQSVLLEVLRQRAAKREPHELLRQYQEDACCAPAPVELRTALAIDTALLAAAPDFEAVELAPVAPLGACSAVAPTDQNRVLSALRSSEVLSDPTNVLALECARRLRTAPQGVFHLATSQRVLRTQPIPKRPGSTQHFRLFALATGGVEEKDHAFTRSSLLLHIRTLLAGLDQLETLGYAFGARSVDVLTTPARNALGDRVAGELNVPCRRELLEHAYYSGGVRFKIWVDAPDGERVPLVDGGTFDWLAQLSANRRAVFVATGAGAQLIALRFRPGAAGTAAGPAPR